MSRKRIRHILAVTLASIALLCSCSRTDNGIASSEESGIFVDGYQQISQIKAKELIDTKDNYIILDVRTKEEFNDKHIENAILIPYDEIEDRTDELPDKNQLILVYCRSGNRSKTAAKTLAELGYTNVKEFGGINNWAYGTVR